ncbi:TrbI/VirB10 family protein [Candidatus Odyssella thessalonicensis]|uniref:TrbI/VirB10 family protein n=1 Tax=Candidatus Odyssella thessalonicensis TaxID=84647 RepID=UPI000225B967|nr:TrbI/VirB10 family protein [Candidatus Odyssella thessalonicensis]
MLNLKDLINKVVTRGRGKSPSFETPQALKSKQTLIKIGVGIVLMGCLVYGLVLTEETSVDVKPKADDLAKKDIAEMATPISAVNEREIWASRVEKQSKKVEEEATKVLQENEFLQKRLDVLEELIKNHKAPHEIPEDPYHVAPSAAINEGQATPRPSSQRGPTFPPATDNAGGAAAPMQADANLNQPLKKRGPKIGYIGSNHLSGVSFKTTDMYFPAGTYSKAVITSGVAASTATNAQGNPQPMMLRLVDDGNLPRGFKSRVKDAVILGACYGDISSERVMCRLETMSWVEPNGTTVEKKVEGWVIGEDGRAGLRGQVVDRSGEVAREAFGAGILSGISNFFKMQAQNGVYPLSAFGATNALSNKEALEGAAASGASSALDKLADFSIKRAEQMQPVILVASGRVVDIVFKSGVDLSPLAQSEMQIYGQNQTQDTGETP